jgi:excinuclease ABC subunit C
LSIDIIKNTLPNIPRTSGIYKFLGADDEILYIGKAKNLRSRLASYANFKNSTRINRMVFLAQKIDFIQTKSDVEAIFLEHDLIKKFSPKFNILLRDDKTFCEILITKNNHEFERITRHRGEHKTNGSYFGPFVSALDTRSLIDIVRKIFLIRNCPDATFKLHKKLQKPCLEYQIKNCSGPCANLISSRDYKKSIKNSIDFLNGKFLSLQKKLAKEMNDLSLQLQYEKAVLIRNKIKALKILYEQKV